MCKVLKVNISSYHRWVRNGCIIVKIDSELNELVNILFLNSRMKYGTRRLKYKLMSEYGVIVSRIKISQIMKYLKLSAKKKKRFKNTTDSNHSMPIAPNVLDRNFNANQADMKYVGDITYIETKEGWLFLATVIDLFSRKIVGWAMDDNMKVSLVNDALMMAIKARKPLQGLIWHTDRGSQYASHSHRDLLEANGIVQSMSRKGNCWDNAVAESFFHTLKTELTHDIIFETRSQANLYIFEYIEVYYNKERSHSANNYLSPIDFEKMMLQSNLGA